MTEEKFARLITAMQDELVAHQEILAFLAFEVSAARGVDIRDLSGRLHAMADGDTRSNIGECVRHFARFIVVGQPPQLSIIDGGKE